MADGKTPMRQAIENSIVIFSFTTITVLAAVGFPPSIESLYVPMLSTGGIAIYTYAKARGIDVVDEPISSAPLPKAK